MSERATKVLIIIILSFLTLFTTSYIYGAIPASERAALIAIYNATDGDNWYDNYNWKGVNNEADGFSAIGTEGDWDYITVEGDHVVEINLFYNDLTGPLPAEIGNFPFLRDLDICGNNLTGGIPTQIGNLSRLTYLDLSDNPFGGTIPPALGNLNNLIDLYCVNCNLTGSIPKELGNLSSLNTLWLEDNQLSGSIPVELQKLSNLQYLWLQYNKLSGSIPKEIGNLSNLTYICLINNELTGSLPPELGNLGSLNYLTCSNNHLSGELPPELGNCAYLRWIIMDSNKIKGPIPQNYKNLNLDANRCNFSYNAIYTDDSTLQAKFDNADPNWDSTQTIAPADVTANALSSSSIEVSWPPVAYQQAGAYNIYYSTGSNGPWTLAGTTSNKSASTYTIDSLNSGTTYYFVIETKTNPHTYNRNTVLSSYSDPAAATTHVVIPGVYTLSVFSTPTGEFPIQVSPADNDGKSNGNTVLTRFYSDGTSVTLTAPESTGNYNFVKWLVDGEDRPGNSVTITMNTNHKARVVYRVKPVETYTLTVKSTHNAGSNITVSPVDENGDSDGLTTFTRKYKEGTEVTLIAPAEHNEHKFDNWKIDGVVKSNSQTITLTITGNHTAKVFYTTPSRPGLVLSRSRLNFAYVTGDETLPSKALRITINGDPVNWNTTVDVPWLPLNPEAGFGTTEVTVSINPEGLTEGKYEGSIRVTAPSAEHSPQTVKVNLTIYNNGATTAPIGEFSTPGDGAVVSSSVPVTGWVVDDMGVENVEILRLDGNEWTHIGYAAFIEGARPDIEDLYPDYPDNYEAGWGYMLLTNFFPNNGNGTFTLKAVATDVEGNQTVLGTKSITCDNANAVKPFGAIETPAMGGIASGGNYSNWGWVLTPQPNMIPLDGSTIDVYIDGVKVGNPEYNIYRADIAGLFPEYANSGGAFGHFDFDTTLYEDGVHTIHWLVRDDAGNMDGIGSRYFSILNSGVNRAQGTAQETAQVENRRNFQLIEPDAVSQIPLDSTQSLAVKRGFGENDAGRPPQRENDGRVTIEMNELERLEISSFNLPGETSGYMMSGDSLRPLPVGSTLNRDGVFTWIPGAGFVGEYRLVFIQTAPDGNMNRRNITVNIIPRN